MPRGIYKRTEEHKKKLSESHKGKCSALMRKQIDNLARLNTGRKHTEEARKNMALSRIGRTNSKETRDKISFANSGDKHYNWKGGNWLKNSRSKYGRDWLQIRKKVFNRDNFTCQRCGITQEEYGKRELDVHHKKPFDIFKDNSLANLKTLCRPCHVKEEAMIK